MFVFYGWNVLLNSLQKSVKSLTVQSVESVTHPSSGTNPNLELPSMANSAIRVTQSKKEPTAVCLCVYKQHVFISTVFN